MDADDELLPEKIEKQLKFAIDNNAVVVFGGSKMLFPTFEKLRMTNVDDVWSALLSSKLGITSANLFNRKILYEVKGWNENLSSSQEYDLMFRILKLNQNFVGNIDVQTIIHKLDESISASNNKNKIKSILKTRLELRNKIKNYLQEIGQFNNIRRKEYNNYQKFELLNNFEKLPLYVFIKFNIKKFNITFAERIKINKYFLVSFFKLKFNGRIKKS